jgi:glycosyltransferase involved in cell wall biosynthesis
LTFNRTGRGTYWRALGFGEELARRGHDVTLLSAAPRSSESVTEKDVGGVHLVQLTDLHRGSGYDPWHLVQRLRWLRRESGRRTFDLVHLFETRPVNVAPGLYLQRRHDVPLFIDWCDWFGRGGSVEERANPWLRALLRPVETFFEERFRAQADGTTVINTVLQQKARALGVAPPSILLLPNGANVDEITPQDRRDVRQRLGLAIERRYLAYTGSIFERDARLMARAFDEVGNVAPDVSLLMIGYCNISIKPLVQRPEAVVESGAVNYRQLADYVAAADVGWLPLANSGANRGRFPMKAHDFIAAGRPLLVSDVGDLGAFVRQHGIGETAPDEPHAQARAALALLEDPQKLDALGRQARRVAVEERAWRVVSSKLEAFYFQQLARVAVVRAAAEGS